MADEAMSHAPSFFRIVIETDDAGVDVRGGIDWLARWAEKVTSEAPFAVGGLRVSAVAAEEVLDV